MGVGSATPLLQPLPLEGGQGQRLLQVLRAVLQSCGQAASKADTSAPPDQPAVAPPQLAVPCSEAGPGSDTATDAATYQRQQLAHACKALAHILGCPGAPWGWVQEAKAAVVAAGVVLRQLQARHEAWARSSASSSTVPQPDSHQPAQYLGTYAEFVTSIGMGFVRLTKTCCEQSPSPGHAAAGPARAAGAAASAVSGESLELLQTLCCHWLPPLCSIVSTALERGCHAVAAASARRQPPQQQQQRGVASQEEEALHAAEQAGAWDAVNTPGTDVLVFGCAQACLGAAYMLLVADSLSIPAPNLSSGWEEFLLGTGRRDMNVPRLAALVLSSAALQPAGRAASIDACNALGGLLTARPAAMQQLLREQRRQRGTDGASDPLDPSSLLLPARVRAMVQAVGHGALLQQLHQVERHGAC